MAAGNRRKTSGVHFCQKRGLFSLVNFRKFRQMFLLTAWDPYRMYQKSWLEQIQRRASCAARFATKTYSRQEGCVTQALNHLNWPLLEHRRKVNRPTLMYKTLHGQAAINIPPYVEHKTGMKTRNSDPMKVYSNTNIM